MANLLGKNIWARRKELPTWYKIGCAVPRRTRSAQRSREEKQWRKEWGSDADADGSRIRGPSL